MNNNYLNVAAFFALCLAVLIHAPARAAGEAVTTFDRWYVLEMAGEHAGYAHSTERHKDGRIVTETDTKLTVRHNGIDRRLTDVHGRVIEEILA